MVHAKSEPNNLFYILDYIGRLAILQDCLHNLWSFLCNIIPKRAQRMRAQNRRKKNKKMNDGFIQRGVAFVNVHVQMPRLWPRCQEGKGNLETGSYIEVYRPTHRATNTLAILAPVPWLSDTWGHDFATKLLVIGRAILNYEGMMVVQGWAAPVFCLRFLTLDGSDAIFITSK